MRKLIITVLCLLGTLICNAQYDKYFTPERLRVDLVFTGDFHTQNVYLKSLHRDSVWAGTRTKLADFPAFGEYHCKAFDSEGELIFATGFSSLFEEWRTTLEAQTTSKAFCNSVWMPMPKTKISFVVYARDAAKGSYTEMQRFTIDPLDTMIERSATDLKAELIEGSGELTQKVDLVFVAEGYTADEMDKFRSDAERFAGYLFDYEPFRSRKSDFNIWILPCPSEESGVDIPQDGVWKRSALNSTFNTFYIDRYLTLIDYQPLANVLTDVPFDTIYVIANTSKYGGGGIFNYYGLSVSDSSVTKQVFVHEFGHSFAGLADEYYDSSTPYNDMYLLNVEPWEQNITSLVDFESKWKDMMGMEGVGLYEGAAYTAKGLYRPAPECRVLNNTAPGFCPVCQRAISRVIDHYTR